MSSRFFTQVELLGLDRLGDLLCPGDDLLPPFSSCGAGTEIDRLAIAMDPRDRADLKKLLRLTAYAPRSTLRALLALLDAADRHAGWPAELRLARLGVAGVIYSLYYGFAGPDGGARVRAALAWDAAIRTEPTGEHAMNLLVERARPPLDTPATAPAIAAVYERARKAQAEIARLPVKARLALIDRLAQVLLKRREEIVERVVAATGKCETDAIVGEIFAVLDNLDFLRKHADRLLADRKVATPLAMLGKRSRVWYEPLGVVLTISPWNYPFYQAIVPLSIALVAGNASVYKPSEFTPLTGLVESVLAEAGFGQDWVQVVYGDGTVGAALVDGGPDKVFFTGSVATGRKIMARAAERLIPVELELGGKDPMLVFADATLERAVAGAMWGAYTNTGQSCTSVERLLVERPIYEAFKARLVAESQKLKLGTDRDSDIGRMTTARQIEIVRELRDDALARGARQLTGLDWDGESEWIPPIVLEGCTPQMRVMQEEAFGPLLPIVPFDTEEQAVTLANQTIYGLSASVWSADRARAERVARRLLVGNVAINNVMITEGNHALPFGGAKQSGIGRFKGAEGLHGFCNIKSVMIDADSAKYEANWYPFTADKYALFDSLAEASQQKGLGGLLRFALSGLKLENLANRLGRAGRSA
ncbi:aldehyde dehydrogenase family protein [Chitinimonas lacunae]|uniref:Aldehyde dehydrogenase family protein n=1 Tax=Chitinimonas lacunae TaxID=1963018 RepID=A0ABV8MQU9_9NEIS